LFNGVIHPRYLWLPVKDTGAFPMLAQTDQQNLINSLKWNAGRLSFFMLGADLVQI